MMDSAIRDVRRVEVSEQVAADRPYDYADAFEVRLPDPTHDPPERWVMAGMDRAPALVGWVVSLLGMDDDWQVVQSTAEVVHLEQSDLLMDMVLVGRNLGPGHRRMTSVLRYRRPVAARLVWSVVGVLHRHTARRVITCVPSTLREREDGDTGQAS